MNRNNKTIRNLFFIFVSTFIIFFICFFNYKMDPYKFFINKDYMELNNYPKELIYTAMKFYKDKKYDTVVVGSSETITLFNNYYKYFFNNISIEGINLNDSKKLLNTYLKIHPETKKVIIVISYINIINYIHSYVPQCKETNITLKEYQQILFSNDSIKKSLICLKNIFIYNILKKKIKPEHIIYFPKQSDIYKQPIENLKVIEKNNVNDIKEIINTLNEKNIDYEFIIPPYNSIFISLIYNQKENQKHIDNFKRYIVSIVPEDKKIYDFAFVNKYTSSNLLENKDGLYNTSNHPSFIFGVKILKVLLNEKYADNSIYLLLNKNNIDKVIKKQHKLIENYIKNNPETIKYYTNLSETKYPQDVLFSKSIGIECISDNSKKEFEYLLQNIEQNEREQFIKYKRLSYLKYYI